MEDYFDWYGMSDIERVRFAKMKLIGSAKKDWHSVQRNLGRLGEPPITQWAVMKQKWKEKYLPTYYRSKSVEQLWNLRQSTSNVSDYLARFEELMLRCEIDEEPFITVSRFFNGLRVDIKREVILYNPELFKYEALSSQDRKRPRVTTQ